MKQLSFTVVAVLLFATSLVAQKNEPVDFSGHKVVRAVLADQQQLDRMWEISPDLWSESVGVGVPTDWRIQPEMMEALDQSGIEFRVIIPDVQKLIEQTRVRQLPPLAGGSWFDEYKSFDEIVAYLEVIRNVQPGLVSTFDVGPSIEGRTIRGIRFGGDGQAGPVFVIQGCQHAREWISPMVSMFVADNLVRNYGVDPEITELVNTVEFIIVPVVNPDGYEFTRSSNRLWRKNMRNNGNCVGVDLNRNWPVGWGGEGSSGDPCDIIYRGTSPFSEPESAAMRDLIESVDDRLGFHLDVHSYGQLLLTPWGYTFNLPPLHGVYSQLANDMRDAIVDVYGTPWTAQRACELYIASGIAGDYVPETYGVPGFTFELRDGGFGFLLPPEQIIPSGEEIVPSILVAANWLADSIFEFSYPNGLPETVLPGVPNTLAVDIEALYGVQIDPNAARVYTRIDNGSFTASPMVFLGGEEFEATLPAAPCGSVVEYYFEVSTTGGNQYSDPNDAPNNVYRTIAGVAEIVFEDNFESQQAWTVENVDLQDGAWERGIPAGDGSRGDPIDDFDGSGRCMLTANRAGNSDVDGGPTRLVSPLFDLSNMENVAISYARWFYNDDADEDRLNVEISNDGGGTWTLVESVGGQGTWTQHEFFPSDFIALTNQMRMRFSASDNPNNSVTEAAIDAFSIVQYACPGPECADGGILVEGTNQVGDFVATCESDGVYWAAHGSTLFFQIADPVVQFELTSTVPPMAGPGNISVEIEASKQNNNGNLILRADLFNFTSGNYVTLTGLLPLTTVDQAQTFGLPGGANPADFVQPGTNEVRLLIRTTQTSGLPNVRTQLDSVLFYFE